MRHWKGDIDIGYRAYAEVLRLFPRQKDAMNALDIRHENLDSWGRGVCPSAKYLARLLKAGADIEYILIGRKKEST